VVIEPRRSGRLDALLATNGSTSKLGARPSRSALGQFRRSFRGGHRYHVRLRFRHDGKAPLCDLSGTERSSFLFCVDRKLTGKPVRGSNRAFPKDVTLIPLRLACNGEKRFPAQRQGRAPSFHLATRRLAQRTRNEVARKAKGMSSGRRVVRMLQ